MSPCGPPSSCSPCCCLYWLVKLLTCKRAGSRTVQAPLNVRWLRGSHAGCKIWHRFWFCWILVVAACTLVSKLVIMFGGKLQILHCWCVGNETQTSFSGYIARSTILKLKPGPVTGIFGSVDFFGLSSGLLIFVSNHPLQIHWWMWIMDLLGIHSHQNHEGNWKYIPLITIFAVQFLTWHSSNSSCRTIISLACLLSERCKDENRIDLRV